MTSQTPDSGPYLDALYESLQSDGTAVHDADPLLLLRRIVEEARATAGDDAAAGALLEALGAVAGAPSLDGAVSLAAQRFETSQAFVEAVFAARCLGRDGATLPFLRSREYVLAAPVPSEMADLSTDRMAVLDATPFSALWREPTRLGWMTELLARWRRDYVSAYAAAHEAHRGHMMEASELIYASAAAARAVEKLNDISRLGAPLGADAIAGIQAVHEMWACDVSGSWLTEALVEAPRCSMCSFALGDRAPVAEAKRLSIAIDRALQGQQARLARHVVSRILSRPSEGETQRLQRFIEVVQASDLSGLAVVLDDELVAFIDSLLASEAPPSTVLARLADSYPEVSADNLDAAVSELRRLLADELSRAETVRLDAPE